MQEVIVQVTLSDFGTLQLGAVAPLGASAFLNHIPLITCVREHRAITRDGFYPINRALGMACVVLVENSGG